MFQTILSFVKDSRFQSALVGALLGGLSTFILAYWGINVDFGSVTPSQEVSETVVIEELSSEPVALEPTVEFPAETLEVVAD